MKIKRPMLRGGSSSHVGWQNLSSLSLIEQTRLNDNNLHQSVSSEPLIEYEETHRTVTHTFAYICACFFDVIKYSWMFEQLNCLDISILESLTFLLF